MIKKWKLFVLSLSFSLASLITSLITIAKITVVVTAVIAVGDLAIKADQITKKILEEKKLKQNQLLQQMK